MPVIPFGRRQRLLQLPLVAEPVDVAYLEHQRFKAEVMNLIETPDARRSDVEKERIYGRLREHLRRFTELYAVNIHQAQQRQELETQLRTMAAALKKAQADILTLDTGAKHARHLARHDGLTLLPNRTYFLECLEAKVLVAQRKKQAIAVFYLDLDGFKAINDTYGHDVGNAVLGITGARLSRVVRADDMVGRLGGDEFACLISGFKNRDALKHFAQKLIETIAAPERVNSLDLTVTISVGIALYPENGAGADSLLRAADAAMYHSKKTRQGYAFSDDTKTSS